SIRHFSNTSDPESFPGNAAEGLPSLVFVSNAPIGSSFYLFGVFVKYSLFHIQRRLFPRCPSFCDDGIIYQEVDLATFDVDFNGIVVFDEGDNSSIKSFRGDMADYETVGSS